MFRRIAIPSMALIVLLAAPRASHAGLADLIWEMSGPQLIGFGFDCETPFTAVAASRCRILDIPSGPAHGRPIWLITDGRVYFSTGKKADDIDYRFWQTGMLGFDPMVGFGGYYLRRVRFTHAVGVSLNLLFGRSVDGAIGNYALKVRPLTMTVPVWKFNVETAYTLRLYRDGFDGTGVSADRQVIKSVDAEAVHGVLLSVRADLPGWPFRN